jgi:hypothetical protein
VTCNLSCRCFRDGQYEQGVGIALESKRLDKLEEAVHRAPDTVAILQYALRVCQRVVASKDFRFQVTIILASCHRFCDWAGKKRHVLARMSRGKISNKAALR